MAYIISEIFTEMADAISRPEKSEIPKIVGGKHGTTPDIMEDKPSKRQRSSEDDYSKNKSMKSFTITLKVSNHPWIVAVPASQRDKVVSEKLKIGHIVSTIVQVAPDPEARVFHDLANGVSDKVKDVVNEDRKCLKTEIENTSKNMVIDVRSEVGRLSEQFSAYKEEVGSMKASMEHIQKSMGSAVEKSVETTHKDVKEMADKLLQSVENCVTCLSHQIHENGNNMSSLQTTVSNLRSTVHDLGGKASSKKGQIGESFVREVLVKNFIHASIDKHVHIKHAGDFLLTERDEQNVLVEVKNYSTNIPQAEVKKFFSDMETTGEQLGLFVSLFSGIAYTKQYQFQRLSNNKYVLFISNAAEHESKIVCGLIALREYVKLHQEQGDDFDDIDNKCKQVMAAVEHLDSMRKEVNKTVSHITKSATDITVQATLFRLRMAEIIDTIRVEVSGKLQQLSKQMRICQPDQLTSFVKNCEKNGDGTYMMLDRIFNIVKTYPAFTITMPKQRTLPFLPTEFIILTKSKQDIATIKHTPKGKCIFINFYSPFVPKMTFQLEQLNDRGFSMIEEFFTKISNGSLDSESSPVHDEEQATPSALNPPATKKLTVASLGSDFNSEEFN